MNPRIQAYIDIVESGEIPMCREQLLLIKRVKAAFENEKIHVDDEQLERYMGLQNILNTNFCHGKNLFLRCITAHTPKAAHCAGLFCLLRLDAALEKTDTWPMKILHLSPP